MIFSGLYHIFQMFVHFYNSHATWNIKETRDICVYQLTPPASANTSEVVNSYRKARMCGDWDRIQGDGHL
jgi:hypothetical protein